MAEGFDVAKVVQLSSNVHQRCDECQNFFSGEDVGEAINHYLSHGFSLLHIGEQTAWAPDGKQLWHQTVAIVGK